MNLETQLGNTFKSRFTFFSKSVYQTFSQISQKFSYFIICRNFEKLERRVQGTGHYKIGKY